LYALIVAAIPLGILILFREEYRRVRLLSFLDPWKDPLDSGFHIIQSLLALGGALASVAIFTRTELFLLIIGGVFVIETLSVILQVASAKLRGKIIFKMSPIHHHFELCGWKEPKIIIRFWITGAILALIGIASI
ncbi:unnamed protein product, partial [marine sediment metagenome]